MILCKGQCCCAVFCSGLYVSVCVRLTRRQTGGWEHPCPASGLRCPRVLPEGDPELKVSQSVQRAPEFMCLPPNILPNSVRLDQIVEVMLLCAGNITGTDFLWGISSVKAKRVNWQYDEDLRHGERFWGEKCNLKQAVGSVDNVFGSFRFLYAWTKPSD